MKLMIASDLHGSAYYTRQLLEAYAREGAEKLLLLGDVLYHGPRNDLPREYAPKEVIRMLNEMKEKLLCVRGNCDTEVDQMVLDFSILPEFALLIADGSAVYVTHGHHLNDTKAPVLQKGDVLLAGHTHIPACEERDGWHYLNPGSVSIPKENSWHGYMMLENGVFQWKDLDGTVKKQWNMKEQ